VLNRYGFKYFCFNFLPNSTQKFEDVLLAIGYQLRGSSYTSKNSLCTPILLSDTAERWFCLQMEGAPYDPEREPRAVEVVQRAMDFWLVGWFRYPAALDRNRDDRPMDRQAEAPPPMNYQPSRTIVSSQCTRSSVEHWMLPRFPQEKALTVGSH
jgi:hypothetical protein